MTLLKLIIEVALACHCATWTQTPHGPRCTVVRVRAACELIEGTHAISFGVLTCGSVGCS